jgi:hypothetical protein
MESLGVIHVKVQLKFDDDMPQHFLFLTGPSLAPGGHRLLPLTARSWIDAGTGIDSIV